MQKANQRIAVLMGGWSAEREGSLMMGHSCTAALRSAGYDVTEIDAREDVVERLLDVRPDVVFNALMGRWGEDGAIQGLLEWMRIPYTHSGVTASAIGMDKAMCRAVYSAAGLPVADGSMLRAVDIGDHHPMDPPYVLKPNNEGSSIGVYYVFSQDDGVPQPDVPKQTPYLVEQFVPGRDLTVGVFKDKGIMVTEIRTESGVWDYASKYHEKPVQRFTPADLPTEVEMLCIEYAERAHRALGCRCISRTDFRWDERNGEEGLIVLETNTQPAIGFKGGTLDAQFAAAGISLAEVCKILIEDASLQR